MEVESHVLHWTCCFNSFLQRPRSMPGPHQQGDWRSVFPGSSADVLHFLCCFMCCLLGARQTGKWSKEECSAIHPQNPPWDPWTKPVEAWAHEEQAPPAQLRPRGGPLLLGSGTCALCCAESFTIIPHTHPSNDEP